MFHIPISAIKYLCAKYTYFSLHRREKTWRTPLIRGDHRPPPQEVGEIPQSQAEEEEGDIVEIVTTTGDRDVVKEGHFTSESAQILIGTSWGVIGTWKTSSKTSIMFKTKLRTSLMF
ncbi:hypothetical protein AB205_0201280 [Aquarana catesbeiana]|uniref:Uncharacterized protein n=1 Tax=Aquarana catesbeiana TaxID=8400 RepID=A0A2G9QJT1_AQUCT|nr:hypothetical protein AB205_0201280 [Aquarana catesbeiana]